MYFPTLWCSLDQLCVKVETVSVSTIAWDASGERLAVSYRDGDELYKGLIAIFDVKRSPLISTSLIGFIRGPGVNPKPIAFSFHDKFKQGPLLSVENYNRHMHEDVLKLKVGILM
ncbi:UNVERIFIED_CONTAM: Aladin [Sesamum radiatum]|uniref:Aladin n=1 Tax=Sesamum radiatum TaxID=300843 RepID=A0AAW2LD97_SESRA